MKIFSFRLSKKKLVFFISLTAGQILSAHAMKENDQKMMSAKTMRSKEDFFEVKSENFWVLKNREVFLKASQELINEQGEWQGPSPYAKTIQYTGELTKKDLPLIEKWLKLKDLQYFSLTDSIKSAEFNLIYPWGQNNILALTKLIWLKKSSIEYQNQRKSNDLPKKWLKNHNQYYSIK